MSYFLGIAIIAWLYVWSVIKFLDGSNRDWIKNGYDAWGYIIACFLFGIIARTIGLALIYWAFKSIGLF